MSKVRNRKKLNLKNMNKICLLLHKATNLTRSLSAPTDEGKLALMSLK